MNQDVSSINDPLYIASSDHLGMTLTNTPFNGVNYHSWSMPIKMALGAKLKLGFIDGTCLKPPIQDVKYQRWIRCNYMVTCWILKSMVAELSDAFLYADSAYELWKEIYERYGQSNGPLIYQNERELINVVQGNLYVAAYFNKMKKFWDELHNLNGILVCTCGQMNTCTCGILDKFFEMESRSKLMQFLMNLNDDFESVRSQILSMYPLPNMNKNVELDQRMVLAIFQKVMKKFKGKNVAHEASTSYHADTGASDHMSPHISLLCFIRVLLKPIKVNLPDGTQKEVTMVVAFGKGTNHLYTCNNSSSPPASFKLPCKIYKLQKFSFANKCFGTSFSVAQSDLSMFHDTMGHTSLSKMTHINDCKSLDIFDFFCDTCLIAKNHRLPFTKRSVWLVYNVMPFFIRDLWCILHNKNGVVEKKYRHLLDTARALKLYANLRDSVWGDCILAATHLINKMPMKNLHWKTPLRPYMFNLVTPIVATTITPFSTPLYTTNDDVIPEQTPLPAEPNTHQPDNEPQVMIDHVPIVSDQAAEPTSSGTSNDNPQVPLRRSQRNTSTPIWLKDFVLPKHIVFNVSKPDKPPLYPLFKEEDF
ncbi:putative RNA-directed DNA polymerase, eukaryota, reverse transcriptase zinc-binding domain protein [Tanacetum coccineum]